MKIMFVNSPVRVVCSLSLSLTDSNFFYIFIRFFLLCLSDCLFFCNLEMCSGKPCNAVVQRIKTALI